MSSSPVKTMWQMCSHFAVDSSSRIAGLQPAHLCDPSLNSTAEDGQHLILSLTADVSDHARKLFFPANLTVLCKKDRGIRPIAVGNVFCHLASMVGCTSVTQSLARLPSPTQIGVRLPVRQPFTQYIDM